MLSTTCSRQENASMSYEGNSCVVRDFVNDLFDDESVMRVLNTLTQLLKARVTSSPAPESLIGLVVCSYQVSTKIFSAAGNNLKR